jgi:RNA polymerase sigma-70 factor, ECF subfamily
MSEPPVPLSPPATPPAPSSGETRVAAWFAEYGPMVYRYVRFNLPSADVAEDVTAETFLKVFQAMDRYDPDRGDPKVWILRIAQNTLRDHFRRTRVRKHVPLGAMRDLASDAPSPEERLLWEEEVARLIGALADLPSADREVISLRYGSGLDTGEVARTLGLREGVVRTRLWRALGRLRDRLTVEPE